MESFEPADPRRTMPKSLVLGTIAAVIILIALMSWLNQRSLQQPDEPANAVVEENAVTAAPAPQAPAPAAAQGPVVLTATAPVWLQVSEKGGPSLFSGMLQPGQTYAVPATATAPVLKTGKPEALKITVGNAVAPAVGPPATTVTNVSLLPASLMGQAGSAPAATAPAAQTAAPPPATRPQAARRPRAAAPAPAPAVTVSPPPAETTPATSNTGE